MGLGEEWLVSGTVDYCCPSYTPSHGSDMVIVDFLESGGLKGSGWGNGNGATLFNSCNSCCVVGSNSDSNYAMVPNGADGTITLVGGYNGNSVLLERYVASTGQRDNTFGPLKNPPNTADHRSWAVGPSGVAYAAVMAPSVNRVLISGSGGRNDFLAARFLDDGTLDTSFGKSGSISIDFGSTSGITTDGGRAMALRTFDGGTTFDIIVAGYTLDAATGKYRMSLVDLLDDNTFDVS